MEALARKEAHDRGAEQAEFYRELLTQLDSDLSSVFLKSAKEAGVDINTYNKPWASLPNMGGVFGEILNKVFTKVVKEQKENKRWVPDSLQLGMTEEMQQMTPVELINHFRKQKSELIQE